MLVSLTVGKVDAGVAVLLTQDNRLIEFPSVLLPNNITSGSIVDITVSRNRPAEAESVSSFQALQKRILNTYGVNTPSPPVLRLRNATQTSLVLEWDPIDLATASLKSLTLYRNDSKAGAIPRPTEMLSTKISGLAIDTEYAFQLVLRTSAGTFSSQRLVCRTHKMTDLSGITVTPGVLPANLKDSLADAVDRIGGKLIDTVRIDTTHFVCTEGRGAAWEKAVEMNIPVVRPEWVEGCEREGTIVSVRGYYLNADPKLRQIGAGVGAQQNRDNAILNSEQTSPSIQRQNVPPNIDSSAEGHEVQRPMVTPFPGAEAQNGARPEDDEDTSDGSPPPPPPKDTENGVDKSHNPEEQDGNGAKSKKNTEPQEDDEEESGSSDDGASNEEATDSVQKSEQKNKSSTAELEKVVSRDQSLPQFRQEESKTNGASREDMDEVPL